jgi:transcriptional regulator of acetoin/glycerol metabolism
MRRVCVRAAGRPVAVEDLPPALQQRRPRRWGTLRSALRQREGEIVQEALDRHDGSLSRAAAELGISRQGLWLKIRRLGLVVKAP